MSRVHFSFNSRGKLSPVFRVEFHIEMKLEYKVQEATRLWDYKDIKMGLKRLIV